MISDRMSTIIACVVVAVWAVSMVVDMIPQAAYEPPIAIYPALMLVLGGIFGIKIVRSEDKRESN